MQMRRLEPLVTSKDDRKFVVPFYRSMGMGTHAIAAATGASQGTVRNDLSTERKLLGRTRSDRRHQRQELFTHPSTTRASHVHRESGGTNFPTASLSLKHHPKTSHALLLSGVQYQVTAHL